MDRLDANYILRYLLDDHQEMASIAENLISSKRVYISNEVLAEVVYVLEGVYDLPKNKISQTLSDLLYLKNIDVDDKYILLQALQIYILHNIDFVDALLCAYSEVDHIYTFDKKLQRCIDNPNGR